MSDIDANQRNGLASASEITPSLPQTTNDYSGYKPLNFVDFISGKPSGVAASPDQNGSTSNPDAGTDSRSNRLGKFFLGLVCLALIVCGIVLVPNVACALGLCHKWDRASHSDAGFMVYSFIFPYQFVFGAFTAGVGGVLFVFLNLFMLNTSQMGSGRVVETLLTVQKCSYTFLRYEYFCELVAIFPLFVLIGFGVSWFTAGCFLLGGFLAVLSGWFSIHIATFGSIRVAAAAESELGFLASCKTIFRAAASISLVGISIAVAGSSFTYVTFRNIRGLLGFSAGVSFIALVSNVASGIYSVATHTAKTLVSYFELDMPLDDPRNPMTVAARVSDHVEGAIGISVEFFEAFVAALVSSSVLATGLPYVQQNQYALCVYNHLHVDHACIAYAEATVKVSFAAQICRANGLYRSFPSLFFMESNSLFVAVPFVVGMLGVLVALVSSARLFYFNMQPAADRRRNTQRAFIGARVQVLVASVLFLLTVTVLSFGFFGVHSNFQRRLSRSIFPRRELKLSNDTTRCVPTENIAGPTGGNLPVLDASLGPYKATNVMGVPYPSPSHIAWRVFVCLVIGQLLALILQVLSGLFTDANYPLTKGVARMGECSTEDVIIQGLGSALSSTAGPFACILASVLGSSALLGSYGIGLAAVSMISSSATTFLISTFETIASSAGGAMAIRGRPAEAQETISDFGAVGNTFKVAFQSTVSGASIVTSFALIAELVRMTDLIPSPVEIIGNAASEPQRHISSVDDLSGTTPNVVVSVFMGVLLPVVFVALPLLGMSRTAYALLVETRSQFRETPDLLISTRETLPRIKKCVRISSKYSLFEMMPPVFILLIVPLMVGFGLGQKALVGFLLGFSGCSYMIGTFMLNVSSTWRNAKRLVECGYFGEESRPGSQWHKSVSMAHAVGTFLQRTSAPSISIAVKLVNVCSIFVVPFMQPDASRWYNGLAILAVAAVMTLGFLLVSHMYLRRTRKKARRTIIEPLAPTEDADGAEDFEQLENLPVSPFYEEGMTVPRRRIAPTSSLAPARLDPGSMTVVPEQGLHNRELRSVGEKSE